MYKYYIKGKYEDVAETYTEAERIAINMAKDHGQPAIIYIPVAEFEAKKTFDMSETHYHFPEGP